MNDLITGLVVGFFLGAYTLGVFHGYRYCANCWLALIIGKKYEDGCMGCVLRLCNQYPYHTEKTLEDD